MNLSQENYYGSTANREYMSKSQFHRFHNQCEAAALAEINGEYEKETSTSLLVGSYVDAAMDGPEELEKFLQEHPEIVNSRTKELKADFKHAEKMVERIKQDRLFTLLTTGEKQVILTGAISGVKFRGKADFILSRETCKIIMQEFPETDKILGGPFCEGAIIDLKTAKDFAPVWSESEGCKVNWADAYDYATQGAIYQELYRQMYGKTLPFIIVAITKEKEPDIDAVFFPQNVLDASLRVVEDHAPIYDSMKNGKTQPSRCEQCDFCRQTKKLTGIRNYKEV